MPRVKRISRDMKRGMAARDKLLGKGWDKRPSVMQELFPEMHEMANEVLFGRLWSRTKGFPMRYRSMITIATLIALGKTDELRAHMKHGMHVGLTKQQVLEIILHEAFYAGWPAAVSALRIAKDVFAQVEAEAPAKPKRSRRAGRRRA